MDGYYPHDHRDLSRDEVGDGVDADELAAIRDAHRDDRESTHWGDCHLFHPRCAVWVLADEVERWRDGIRQHRYDMLGHHSDDGNNDPRDSHLWALLGEGNDE